ncbi:hypothetical protein HMPREF2883_12585 [Actinomyces sp. HMSC075C01]|nr:hypothetical protein HMPREF2883_12585 [Actinomyces sp. HMSC075C01]
MEHRELFAHQFSTEKSVQKLGSLCFSYTGGSVEHQNYGFASLIIRQRVEGGQHPLADRSLADEMIRETVAKPDQGVTRDDWIGVTLNFCRKHSIELCMNELGRIMEEQMLRVEFSH